jgi:hypothetical protein
MKAYSYFTIISLLYNSIKREHRQGDATALQVAFLSKYAGQELLKLKYGSFIQDI